MQNPWLEKYHQRNQAKKSERDTFDAFMELSETPEFAFNERDAWKKVSNKLEIDQSSRTHRIGFTVPVLLKVAAVFTMFALSIVFYQISVNKGPEMVTIEAVNQPVNHELPDGSTVYLDAYSSIKYPAKFEDRTIEFKGIGYYDVVKAGSTFTVEMGDLKIEVLGTQFSLVTEEEELKTYVVEGEVQVSSDKEALKVNPGEELTYLKGKATFNLSTNADPNILSWKTGKFVFKNSPLPDVLSQLQKHYKVEFTNVDRYKKCKVTAEFEQEKLSEVLAILSEILDVRFNISGTSIKTVGKGCQ